MLFDPATLPDRKWLTLSEVVNFLVFGEILDVNATLEASSLLDRALACNVQEVLQRCPDTAHPEYSPWTMRKLEAAREQVGAWFASGKVVFKGHRLDEEGQDMGLERIRVKSSEEVGIFWEGDFISATTRATTIGTTPPGTYRAQRVWDRVCIKRASLVSYLSGGPGEPEVEPEENAPVEQLPDAFALDVDASVPAPPSPTTMKGRDIWRGNEPWPRDRRQHVFLARAVQQIGKALFGNEWTGQEKPAPLPDTSGEVGSSSNDENEAEARFEKVQATIEDAAEAGELITKARAEKGGEMRDLPLHFWNTDEIAARFCSCQIDPDHPFDEDPPVQAGPHWLYVTTESLQRFIAGLELSNQPNSRVEARKRTIQYLTPLFAEPRPPGMNKTKVKAHCMTNYGISERQFRALWDSMDKHSTWSQPGAPKSSQ